jgi:hypothetical protein
MIPITRPSRKLHNIPRAGLFTEVPRREKFSEVQDSALRGSKHGCA